MDRVPDYLDNNDQPHLLSIGTDSVAVMQTNAGMSLRLGDVSFGLGAASPQFDIEDLPVASSVGSDETSNYEFSSGIFDFEILGGAVGQSQSVVLPLSSPLLENSVYRKYDVNSGQWRDFIEDQFNAILSAAGDTGTCPAPGSEQYVSGLVEGYRCVQLIISDGGPNDADSQANGSIKDPGAVASPAPIQPMTEQSGNSEPDTELPEQSAEVQASNNRATEPEPQAASGEVVVRTGVGGLYGLSVFTLLLMCLIRLYRHKGHCMHDLLETDSP